MSGANGGEDRLAPVTELFGAGRAPKGAKPSSARRVSAVGRADAADDAAFGEPSDRHPARRRTAAQASSDAGSGSDARPIAEARAAARPVRRLRALQGDDNGGQVGGGGADGVSPAGRAEAGMAEAGWAEDAVAEAGVQDPEELVSRATEALVRKLRARSLSIAEASSFLRGLELNTMQIEEIVDEFLARKYLDDRILAGHLVLSGHERKGLGRVALGRVLAQRGIPREIADEALEELPDDDFERALEFARSKARSMGRLDFDTANRRLSGQLARRGYSGALVSKVVRQALQEQSLGGRTSGVRFE